MSNPLKTKRLSIGLTQVEVAKKAGITARGYQRYEADEKSKQYREPGILTAIKIADALGVEDLRELWNTTDKSF